MGELSENASNGATHLDILNTFATVGLIAHHFEQCELSLSGIFQTLCEADNHTPFEILGQVVSTNMRLDMVKTALRICLPRPSQTKDRVIQTLSEFKACQKLRNRAIHQSILPVVDGDILSFVGRPLPHQTMRYSNGMLKDGHEISERDLKRSNDRITDLAFAMRDVEQELRAFLAERKQRRLHRHLLAAGYRKADH